MLWVKDLLTALHACFSSFECYPPSLVDAPLR